MIQDDRIKKQTTDIYGNRVAFHIHMFHHFPSVFFSMFFLASFSIHEPFWAHRHGGLLGGLCDQAVSRGHLKMGHFHHWNGNFGLYHHVSMSISGPTQSVWRLDISHGDLGWFGQVSNSAGRWLAQQPRCLALPKWLAVKRREAGRLAVDPQDMEHFGFLSRESWHGEALTWHGAAD